MAGNEPVSLLDPQGRSAKPTRGDAIGTEIPVTVHASRTAQALGKNLPIVHEDTKTVIILQQGAVVRLSAALNTGETVVLTNRMTGADVLCRVGKIKSQPGIQHYVDLEFIQRAPNFWGDHLAATSAPAAPQAPAAAPSRSIAVPPGMNSAAPRPAVVPSRIAPPASPAPVAAQNSRPAATVPPAPVPAVPTPVASAKQSAAPRPAAPTTIRVAPAPVQHVTAAAPSTPASDAFQSAPLAEPVATAWNPSQSTPLGRTSEFSSPSSFGTLGSESVIEGPSGARKNMLAAAAAVVLVVGGAAGGYRFYARQSHATTPAPSQQNAITSPAPVSEPVVATDTAPVPDPEPAALAVAPPAPEPTTDIVSESRPVRPESRQLPARAPTPKVAAANTAAPRHVVPVEQLKAPTLKQAAARMEPGAPPPVVADSLNLGETAAGNTLLAAVAATAAAPPVSAGPAVGGHLQPPQVLNSTAPVYPMNARMQKIQGVVMLDALIDESGKVVSTTVISGPQPLVVAAQQAVQNWKYKPAQLNGKPVTVHAKVNVRFALQ